MKEVSQRREGRLLVRYGIGLSGSGDGYVHILSYHWPDHVSESQKASAGASRLYGSRTLLASVKTFDRVIFNLLYIVGNNCTEKKKKKKKNGHRWRKILRRAVHSM